MYYLFIFIYLKIKHWYDNIGHKINNKKNWKIGIFTVIWVIEQTNYCWELKSNY